MYLRAIALALGLFALPLAGEAQPAVKIARIGVLANSPGPPWEGFRRGLRDLGYIEGQNIAIEWRWTEGRVELAPELAMDLVRLKVDVIVASAPPAIRAVQQATTTIPIVFTAVSDPIDSGFVRSLARPGGNLTGLASSVPEGFSGKLLELAREAIPSAKRVGVLFNAGNPRNYFDQFAPQWAEAAKALKLELQRMDMRRPEDLDSLFSAAHQARVDVITLVGDPLIFQHRMRIHDLADQYRIPTIQPTKEYLAGRGLLSYGANLTELISRAAVYVDRILKGGKPAELPVEQPRQYELVVNLRSAKALGLAIAPSLLLRADQVIE
jgi:putative tryptophan/tyrosine transport system substrate-binding protein